MGETAVAHAARRAIQSSARHFRRNTTGREVAPVAAWSVFALSMAILAAAAEPDPLAEQGREVFRIEREAARAAAAHDEKSAPPRTTASGPPSPSKSATAESLRNDAWLHDVAFVDPRRGWAVGDRGAIWQTDDGGRNWRQQESGVACPLRSVCFLDAETGWAAGGFSHPYLHSSSGVVLATRDGGRHWHRDPRLMIPALRQIRFFDAKRGWAAGNSSPMFPAGVFLTRDGGRSWTPLSGTGVSPVFGGGWLTADLRTGWHWRLASVRRNTGKASATRALDGHLRRTQRTTRRAQSW